MSKLVALMLIVAFANGGTRLGIVGHFFWQNRFGRLQLKARDSADRNLSGPFAIDSAHRGETI